MKSRAASLLVLLGLGLIVIPHAVIHGRSSATTTTIAGDPNPVVAGSPLVLTATVTSSDGAPTGTVAFYDGPTALGNAALDGTGTATLLIPAGLTVGHHTVAAAYAGDGTFGPSGGAAVVIAHLGLSAVQGEVYTPNAIDGTVSVLDPQTLLRVVDDIPVGGEPSSVAFVTKQDPVTGDDIRYALVSMKFSSQVAVIDMASRSVLRYIDVDPGGVEPLLGTAPNQQRAYVTTSNGSPLISVLDISSNDPNDPITPWAQSGQIDLSTTSPGVPAYPMVFASGDSTVGYAGAGYHTTPTTGFYRIALAGHPDHPENTVIDFIPVDTQLNDLAINPLGTHALLGATERIIVVDLATGSQSDVLCGPDPCTYLYVSGIEFSEDGSRAFAVDDGTLEIIAIDTSTLMTTGAASETARVVTPVPAAAPDVFAWEIAVASNCAYLVAYDGDFGDGGSPAAVIAYNVATDTPRYAGIGLVGDGAFQLDAWGTPECPEAVRLPTTTDVSATPNPAPSGDSVLVTAAVAGLAGPAAGNVTFADSNGALDWPYLLDENGMATFDAGALPDGVYTINVSYGGDDLNAPSEGSVTFTVGEAATVTALAAPGSAPLGETITLEATVSAPASGTPTGGTVVFADGSTTLGEAPLVDGVATLGVSGLALGGHSVTATYGGDALFLGSASEPVTVTIELAATDTTLQAPSSALLGDTVTLEATVTSPSGVPGGTVSFFDGSTLLGEAPLLDGVATLPISAMGLGSHSLTASYGGDGRFNGSSSDPVPLTISRRNQQPDANGAAPTQACFWPPNHKFASVGIVGVTDADGDPLTITVTGITSDEGTASAPGVGGGNHAPDAGGIGTPTALIRVERSGRGDGRVYEISFDASDGHDTVSGSVKVGIPHDQRRGGVCGVDSGQIFNATVVN